MTLSLMLRTYTYQPPVDRSLYEAEGTSLRSLKWPEKKYLYFVHQALPLLRLLARAEACEYYSYTIDAVGQHTIDTYLFYHREYDVVEISLILGELRREYVRSSV